jgi:hypothetical protein
MYEKEIEKMEQLIRENLYHYTKRNSEESNFLNFVDIQKELYGHTENNELICMISQLDTPSYQITNQNNPSGKRVNSVQNIVSPLIINKDSYNSNYFSNNKYEKNIIDFDDGVIEEEDEGINDEVQINKINNMEDHHNFFENKDK